MVNLTSISITLDSQKELDAFSNYVNTRLAELELCLGDILTEVQFVVISDLNRFPLRKLTLEHFSSIPSTQVSKLRDLETLDLEQFEVGGILEGFRDCTKMRMLTLHPNSSFCMKLSEDIDVISGFTNLEELEIVGPVSVDPSQINLLIPIMGNLSSLSLFLDGFPPDGFVKLLDALSSEKVRTVEFEFDMFPIELMRSLSKLHFLDRLRVEVRGEVVLSDEWLLAAFPPESMLHLTSLVLDASNRHAHGTISKDTMEKVLVGKRDLFHMYLRLPFSFPFIAIRRDFANAGADVHVYDSRRS